MRASITRSNDKNLIQTLQNHHPTISKRHISIGSSSTSQFNSIPQAHNYYHSSLQVTERLGVVSLKLRSKMASTQCFLHHHALTTTTRSSSSSSQRLVPHNKPNQIVCKAQKQDDDGALLSRRFALTVLIGIGAAASKVSPADAAYGEAANVFGKPKTNTDFIAYNGNGFKLSIPSKWNPSREVEYPGQVLRYEDNFDANSYVTVTVTDTDKKSITDYGSPEEFLSKVDYLLGKQAYFGKTDSEGGFESGAVATANILESLRPVIGGNQHYSVTVLTRTADGDEGGKHQLITATVKDGKLYICKAQAGDKRWFKGARKFVESTASSFSVA